MTSRRGFLQAILTCGVAPAVVGSGVLMPVRSLWKPEATFTFLDDAELGAWNDGLSLDEIIRRTIRKHTPEMVRNIEQNNALLRALTKPGANGKIKLFSADALAFV